MKDYTKKKSRGRKITISLDGEWSEYLTKAVASSKQTYAEYTTKQAYVEEAVKRRLVKDGFHPPEASA